MSHISTSPVWHRLNEHANDMHGVHLRTLFEQDSKRFERFSLAGDGLLLDFSKNRITVETLEMLLELAVAARIDEWRARMFNGEAINSTERRAVLHVALRREEGECFPPGNDVNAAVVAVRRQMRQFVTDVHEGRWLGATGKQIRHVVNLGIGGSSLGPEMAYAALAPWRRDGIDVHFIANVDGDDLHECLRRIDPAATLCIVASKSFTTQETMANAAAARRWLVDSLGDDSAVARHFVALSTNTSAVAEFGIDTGSMFEFWDWVGGRYSLWSAIGLSVALGIGMDRFEELLRGARAMDEHFLTEPHARNMPILMALLGIWNRNFLGAPTLAVIPYSHRLRRFAAYLQQLDMESNGKSTRRNGDDLPCASAPVLWGEPGTNGQHSFFQLLHQGGGMIPVDFIGVVETESSAGQQRLLLANLLAQSAALMRGQDLAEARDYCKQHGDPEELAPHRTYPGNTPSNTLLVQRLTPYALGQLVALYEHRTFVQGVVWDINSFDQWGVELGKRLADDLLSDAPGLDDASTRGLLAQCREWGG